MMSESTQPNILRFDTLDSTNTKAKDLAKEGQGEGTVVIATQQTAGKGSRSKSWHSPPGGLYLSLLLYPSSVKRAADLAIVAGVGLAQGVKQLMPKSVSVSVKWPNDCLVNGKKVGGILCESLGDEALGLCVVGVGLNVNLVEAELECFSENPFGATSMQQESAGGEYSMAEVEKIVLAKLFAAYRLYQTDGMNAIVYLWEKNCEMIGKTIEVAESGWRQGDTFRPESVKGNMLGIDESGALIVANARGDRRQFYSGVITCYWP